MQIRRLLAIMLATIGLTIAVSADVYAQRVEATVNATEIGTQERLILTVTVEGASFDEVEIPNVPVTRGLAARQQRPSASDEIRIVNGDVSRILRYTWMFDPIHAGAAVIDPIQVRVSGSTHTTTAIRVTVVDQSQRRRGGIAGSTDDAFSSGDLFIRAFPDKQEAYLNEQVIVEYRLYFREGVQLRQSRLAGSWDAPGFWREELDVDLRPVPEREVVNGLHYQTIVLKRVAMFPTREGRLSVQPLRIETEARPRQRSDRLDAFFAYRNRFRTLELASPAVSIDVHPLPPGAPPGFTGAVGQFDVETQASDVRALPGDPISRQIDVAGTGNIAMIDPPPAPGMDEFDLLEPRTRESVDRSGRTFRGRKSFDYVSVPREPGTFMLPPLAFSYFDPAEGAYQTVESASVLVEVLQPDIAAEGVDRAATVPDGIVRSARWSRPSRPLHRMPWAYAPAAGALLAWLLLPGLYRVQRRREQENYAAASRREIEGWRKRLKRIAAIPEPPRAFHEARTLLGDIVASMSGGERVPTARLLPAIDRLPGGPHTAALKRSVLIIEEARYQPGEVGREMAHRLLAALEDAVEAASSSPRTR